MIATRRTAMALMLGALAACGRREEEVTRMDLYPNETPEMRRQIEHHAKVNGVPVDLDLEDIHMVTESRLAQLIGPTAGRLHTARSRNDQVATDFRLWTRDAIDGHLAAIRTLAAVLAARALEHHATVMPGFNHLQVAQPVTLGHHLMLSLINI